MKKPKVLILRTAGTNCDAETEAAFQLAGAENRLNPYPTPYWRSRRVLPVANSFVGLSNLGNSRAASPTAMIYPPVFFWRQR